MNAARFAGVCCVLLASMLASTVAQQPSTPDRAAAAFRDGEFATAIELYQRALADPAQPAAAVLHNLGNCAHALGRPAEAVLHYRRALLRAPGDFETTANLRLVEQQLGLTDAGAQTLGATLFEAAAQRLGAVPSRVLLALAAVLQTLGLAGWVLARRRAWASVAIGAGLALGAPVVVGAFAPTPPEAVVLRDDSRVRSEPHPDLTIMASLRAGETVRVLEASDRWARVARGDDVGWTEVPNLGFVD